jgi:GWxTD domain-containing protein
MKNLFLLFCLTLFTSADVNANGRLTAYLTYANFNVPGKSPYIETYLSVIGNSVKFVRTATGKFQGAVDIAISFTQGEEIKNAKKYTLNSPETTDTSLARPSFIDMQRFSLPNGSYNLELTVADKNNPDEKPFSIKIPITINYTEDKIMVSDIEVLESFTKSVTPNILTKNGYDLVPYVSTFFPENISKLKFYAEIYNSKKQFGQDQKLLLNYFIESFEKKVKLTDYNAFSKQAANDVNVLLAEFNIDKLPNGNYNLVVEARDKENQIQAEQRYFFQRKNSKGKYNYDDLKIVNINNTFVTYYTNIDTMVEYMRSLRPISSFSEIQYAENQLKEKNLEVIQKFFYNFWKARNEKDPELMWLEYSKEVIKVNKEFGTHGLKGYDTDRGRVYLQYGAPDQRTKVDVEPSALPYEIWEYYRLYDRSLAVTYPENKQSNKKFVFYNPDMVTNKFMLIHSTAQGEINNARWELLLHKRDTQSNNLDDTQAPTHYGGNADEYFKNTR